MDLTEFFDGTRTPRQLGGFIDRLPRNSHYWTARSQDVEMYRASVKAGAQKRKQPPPPMHEYSPELEALGALFFLMQRLEYAVANANVPKNKRKSFKGTKWPTPITAADLVRKDERRRANEHLDSMLRFVPRDEWNARQAERARRAAEQDTPPPSDSSP